MNIYNMKMFLISISPWPIFLSLSIFLNFLNMVLGMGKKTYYVFFVNFILLLFLSFFWWNDVVAESLILGFHSYYIIIMTMNSMILFIISEIFFFVSFFWTLFHSMLSPDIVMGSNWPPVGLNSVDYMNLPLLNSILLLSSGSTVTMSHHYIMINMMLKSKISLLFTILLGIIFIMCQFYEYKYSLFSFSDSVFGSIFFMSTGFHGIHVIIGSLFLFIMLLRMNMNNFSNKHFLGFEFSIWYWHFVDIVWLYLFMMVYWLGC